MSNTVSKSEPHTGWPDLAGRIVVDQHGRHHLMGVRVYFEDTDFSGAVYHTSYLRWCERGRSDFLRLLGNGHQALIDGAEGREPAAFFVRRMSLEFLKPARIDEILEVRTRVKQIGAAHVVLAQTISRGDTRIFEADATVVLVSLAGKPLRLSKVLRAAFGQM